MLKANIEKEGSQKVVILQQDFQECHESHLPSSRVSSSKRSGDEL